MSLPLDGERPYAAIFTLEQRTENHDATVDFVVFFTVRCCQKAENLWREGVLTIMEGACGNCATIDPRPAMKQGPFTGPCGRCGMEHVDPDRRPIDTCPACGLWLTGPSGVVTGRGQYERQLRRRLDEAPVRRWERA